MTTMYEPAYSIKAGYRAVDGVIEGNHLKSGYRWWVIGKDVYASPVEARAAAERRRLVRVASLTRQLEKLNLLSHAAPSP